MIGVVTAAEMKSYDRYAIEQVGIPAMVLMERAALCVTQKIEEYLQNKHSRICIVCGVGNNGADGLAIARMLREKEHIVEVFIYGDLDNATSELKQQKSILSNYPISVSVNETLPEKEYDVIVDAIFGVGLTRAVEGLYKDVIDRLNSMSGVKVAVDIPSGISADTGQILGVCFKADVTVTFAFPKRGLYFYPGTEFCGKIVIADIGISPLANSGCTPAMCSYEKEDIEKLLPNRNRGGNKGTFGKVLIIAGFDYMVGAAVLCAKACYEMGAGMVKVICPEENRGILQQSVPEILYGTCEELESSLQWADVVVAGPGMGNSQVARELLLQLLESCQLPMVMDADALNMLAVNKLLQDRLCARGDKGYETILTPHMGEFSRLTGTSVVELKADVATASVDFAKAYQIILTAKDARTVVADAGGRLYLNHTGNSGMATAGSGDVLAGIMGGLLAQGLTAFHAATLGVYLHSLAGDVAAEKYSEYGVTAGRILENISNLKEIN